MAIISMYEKKVKDTVADAKFGDVFRVFGYNGKSAYIKVQPHIKSEKGLPLPDATIFKSMILSDTAKYCLVVNINSGELRMIHSDIDVDYVKKVSIGTSKELVGDQYDFAGF